MHSLAFRLGVIGIVAACGGEAFLGVDGSTSDGQSQSDGSSSDGSTKDVSTKDGPEGVDASSCTPPNKACDKPCPSGTYCLVASGPTTREIGCTPIPPACNGVASCACMAGCFCSGSPLDMCIADPGADSLVCNNGTVSRREFKKDIHYISDVERSD